jgi:hypothetical protein
MSCFDLVARLPLNQASPTQSTLKQKAAATSKAPRLVLANVF